MRKEEILAKVRDTVLRIFGEKDIELVDMTYRREGNTNVLRILADTRDGITVDECARMNVILGEALDRENCMDENYVLEISSPGLDRPLKTQKDYSRVIGKRVQVYTYAPIQDRKEFNGSLESVDESGVTISSHDCVSTRIPFDKISKATLDYKNIMRS